MKRKKNIKWKTIRNTVLAIAIGKIMTMNKVFATTIGAAEVETATQNIRDAVIKLAMPVRFCTHVCKYSYYSNKTDCKCK